MNTPAYTPPATHDTWPPATPDEQSLPPAPLAGRRLVLGVTGGVAAYKAAQLVRDLGRAGAQVQVVMTEAATRFVGAVTFQALSGNPVYTDAFDARIDDNMPHIELSRQADAILVAPATADFIAKLAHGHCDDLLSTLCVARDIPLLVAPAMNRQMWQNPATQRNINQLRADGIGVLGPDAGEQACGEVGAGRMLEPLDLIEELNAFFTPNWSALSNPSVWVAAYGQIFYSLSVSFGIMMTYASYLKPRTNLTGTGMVTAFANSSFEVLAGIGVFSALGFMAAQSGTTVKDAASSGIGLAFIAFPTIINEMPGGAIFGVLFFGSLTIAGFTSLFSLFEVVVSAVRDKLNLPRKQTAITMGVIMAVLSLALFANTGGIVNLDIMDKFTNNVGIVSIALILIVILDWVLRRIDEFSTHLNMVSSFRVGTMWRICVVNITTLVLGFTLFQELFGLLKEPYGGYTTTQVGIYGWGVLVIILVAAAILTTMKWPEGVPLDGPPGSDFGVDPEVERVPKIPQQYKHDERPRIAGFAVEQYTDEELHS